MSYIFSFIGFVVLALLMCIVRLFRVKVWLFVRNKDDNQKIGYMDYHRNEVPEVKLVGRAKSNPIGRVKMGEEEDDDKNAYVEILTSDLEDESASPVYQICGYITPEGLIYSQSSMGQKPKVVGYTARPSNPNKPETKGERSFRSLWMRCELNVYGGEPPKEEEATANEETPTPTEETPRPLPEEENQQPMEDDIPSTKNDTPTTGEEDQPEEPIQEETSYTQATEPETQEPPQPSAIINANSDKPGRKKVKQPLASTYYVGFGSPGKDDNISPEARGAAYALLYKPNAKKKYREFYNSPAYGWKDTALFSAFVYSIVYVLSYITHVHILGEHFIGRKFWYAIPIFLSYFALWTIVRAVKIRFIENSNTIQPKLDLFNKAAGQKSFDRWILIASAVTLIFTGAFHRYNFVALALVVLIAMITNRRLRSTKKPWAVENPFVIEDSEEESLGDSENPQGDIAITYQWELDWETRQKQEVTGEINLYFDSQYITNLRLFNPFYQQRKDKPIDEQIKDMYRFILSHRSRSARLRYIAKEIKRISRSRQLFGAERLQFVLDFAQEPNIRYTVNRDSESINRFESYIRYPDETLYDKEGDSNSKAFLSAMLFHYMGYNTVFLYSRVQKHGAIGVELPLELVDETGNVLGRKIDDVTFKVGTKRYIFCETTGDRLRLGGTMEGMKFTDFDIRVELPKEGDAPDTSAHNICLYNWDLDSPLGHKLHGRYQLEFDTEVIEELRKKNPFRTYGHDGRSYEDNIRSIFAEQTVNPERLKKIEEIADYIRKEIKEKELPEIDLVQFALDFCQEPNIKYVVDKDSSPIGFAEEYMRFPEEVLYDQEGDCDCKSSLTAALFRALGYNVLFLISQKKQHAAIGIELNDEWLKDLKIENDDNKVIREYKGHRYIYCETTGDGLRIGQIKDADTINDFETVVPISKIDE